MTPTSAPVGLRLTLLLSWKEEGSWYLLRRLRQAGLAVTVRSPWMPAWSRPLARLMAWASRFSLPAGVLLCPGQAQVVASWSLPCAAVLGLLRRLTAFLGPQPLHLARDFHIDPSRAGQPIYALKLRLLGWALEGIDLVLTTSRAEAAQYAALFGRPAGQFRFFPDEPASELFDLAPQPCAGHVFAYGNSDRDFDTVLRAAAGLDARFLVLSQTYAPRVPIPANVTLLRRFVSRRELIRLVATAACCVVPLRDDRVAAGQNALFEAMALARPLIVARNVAVEEYVVHGDTGRLYRPGDAAELAAQIRYCLDHPDLAEVMARRGRQAAREWLDRGPDLLLDILGELFEKRTMADPPA